jgi:hypothetical protein
MNALDPKILRQLVSEAVREVLASQCSALPESVTIATDDDLQRFIRRIVTLMEDPATAAQLRAGTMAFQLNNDRSGGTSVRSGPVATNKTAPLSGIVSEKIINDAAEGKELMLGPNAVVTPIARDRARERGISLIRSKIC